VHHAASLALRGLDIKEIVFQLGDACGVFYADKKGV